MTLADIFRQHGVEYLALYEDEILPSHKQAIRDILLCRTEALGGHTWYCDNCDEYHYNYHSCKNRNCPQCQNEQATQWLNKQKEKLIPVEYFMATFTLPGKLRRTARSHQKQIYKIFFQAATDSLKNLAKDKRFIGGNIGMIGILQTWTRTLEYHPHIHFIIPGIAISANNDKILFSKKGFLMHANPLAKIFKAIFLDALKESNLIDLVPTEVWKKEWVIDIEAVGSGQPALKYLSAYLYRIAISNKNIISCKDGMVSFRYKENNSGNYKIMTLPALEFIRRYLQHVLPKGFQKIRYFGFLHPKNKIQFSIMQLLLKVRLPVKEKHEINKFVFKCPKCGKEMKLIYTDDRKRAPPLEKVLSGLSVNSIFKIAG